MQVSFQDGLPFLKKFIDNARMRGDREYNKIIIPEQNQLQNVNLTPYPTKQPTGAFENLFTKEYFFIYSENLKKLKKNLKNLSQLMKQDRQSPLILLLLNLLNKSKRKSSQPLKIKSNKKWSKVCSEEERKPHQRNQLVQSVPKHPSKLLKRRYRKCKRWRQKI